MPLESSLNVSPYFDDYDQAKEFYRILFKPGVSVQTRELNQLQTILQNQVERFGNHVFKSGTIVSGVNFSYLSNYPFVKILDAQGDGQPSLPSSYNGYFVKSDLNLTARVVNYQDGLESKSPDLKTLYLQYVSSSDQDTSNGNAVYTSFVPGQQLTVFSKNNELFSVTVTNGGLGFSNSDTVVVMSSLAVTGNTAAFSNGETITQSTTGAKAVIAAINTTAIANTLILQVKPRTVDMTNTSVNAAAWSFTPGYNIVGGSSGATANVASLIGSGAEALLVTDTQGIVQTVTLSSGGSDYAFLPKVSIKTSNSSATVNNLDLEPKNYKATITVGNSSINSVGTGYAFAVSEGIIYQKGFFLRVDPQVVIVDKYTTSPNNVAVGFKTVETFINSYGDETLYDNASNTTNYSAPGADRLKLKPELFTLTLEAAAANVDFFALAEWKAGYPYKENRVTAYNTLADELARRTREAQGDFVVDPFVVSTKEQSTPNTTHVNAVIDPGTGYISGYRVQTNYNDYLPMARSSTTVNVANQTITLNFGNYIKVSELVGVFNFKAGDQVDLYDTASGYISAATVPSSGAISPTGSKIGSARIRSLVVDSGTPGTASCVYRLYVFDVQMDQGRSFRDVRAVYYNGAVQDGIATVVLTYDATSGSSVAQIVDVNTNKMLFNLGRPALNDVSNITYTIRTNSDTSLQIGQTYGSIQIGPLGTGETFPYSDGTLGSVSKKDFIVMPVANAEAASNIGGGVTAYANTTLIGSSTTFASDVFPGDFIKIANSSASIVRQIQSIANNTSLTLTTAGVAMSGNVVLFFPALYPLALENRPDRTVTVSGGSKTAVINIGKALTATVNVAAVYNKTITGAAPVAKTMQRNAYVKIHTSNNAATNLGPWALGVPGAARLRNVYLGSNTTVNTNSTDVTKYFYIDTGDDENAYRTSKLVLQQGATLTLSANQFMLVKFDAYTSGGEGFYTRGSYNIDDTITLAASTTTVNTLEIPETQTTTGEYYDLRDAIDFRPYSVATATLASTPAAANINPSAVFSISGADQLWPAPDSVISFDASYYNARTDRVTLDKESTFKVIAGNPGLSNTQPPQKQQEEVTLSLLTVPPYPSLPTVLNTTTLEFASKLTGTSRGILSRRVQNYTITPKKENGVKVEQPARYTMADIGRLDRRITNLEYTTSLTRVETAIKDAVIPSAITPTVNRFKHGFFVDTFGDYSHSDTTNREFRATVDIEKGLLKPSTKQINFEAQFNRSDAPTAAAIISNTALALPFVEETLIDQSIKSAVVGSDGNRVQFVGTGTITPPTFSIKTRGQIVDYVPPPSPVVYDGTGSSADIGGGW